MSRATAFEDRAGRFIFVAIPDQRGRYLRTDRSVVQVACAQCKAPVGKPCKAAGGDGWSTDTHRIRRVDARRSVNNSHEADDVVAE